MYTQFLEICGLEGEKWNFFIIQSGNEAFIESLKKNILKFEDEMRHDDNQLIIVNENVSAFELEVFQKLTGNRMDGYMNFITVDNSIKEPLELFKKFSNFNQYFYKGSLFED